MEEAYNRPTGGFKQDQESVGFSVYNLSPERGLALDLSQVCQ